MNKSKIRPENARLKRLFDIQQRIIADLEKALKVATAGLETAKNHFESIVTKLK